MPFTVPRVQAVPLTDDQVSFQVAGRERLRWHGRPNAPRPFFFPLVGPAGRSLSRMGHPADPTHDHHRSLFLGHHDVAGVSFWADGPRDVPGPTIRQDAWLHYQDGSDDAAIAVDLGWYDAHKVRLIKHQLIAVVRPLAEGECFVELQSTFVPELDELTLGKTNFGFFGLRVAASLSALYGGGKLTNSEGNSGEAAIFQQPARWVDTSGPIADGIEEGVTWFDHPANPRHPARWHVRDDGWFSPAFCQRDAYVLRKNFPPTVRYGLHLHRGPHDAERAAATFAAFSASAAWKLEKADKPWKWHLRRAAA